MNKTDLMNQLREEMAARKRVHKHLPHGKLMNYAYLTDSGVSMGNVDTFKEFMWQLARFGDDVELYHYSLYSSLMAITYTVYPDRENELTKWGNPWSYNVTFYIRVDEKDTDRVQSILNRLGIECDVSREKEAPSKPRERTVISCRNRS